MAFSRDEVSKLLSQCHRRCCICHRFCGVKMETDHIIPYDQGGGDNIDNAIPVCFECHAEIHSYNDRHPRGRKFHPDELRLHKEQWLKTCAERPDIFISATHTSDVGPLQALIDELEFNVTVANAGPTDQGCKFLDQQFLRAVHEGSVSILRDEIRDLILKAYHSMGAANVQIDAVPVHVGGSNAWATASNEANRRIIAARPKIMAARDELLKFLSNDTAV
jgi:hypothetical protein